MKQGDLASAVLFCIVLLCILLETFDSIEYGINLGGETITDKGYADDVGLMTETITQMNVVLDRLSKAASKYGLSISVKKTKVILLGNHILPDGTIPPVLVNNTTIERVEKFEYLGRILSHDADDTAAVKRRIGCGWNAFNKVKTILCNRRLSMSSKCKTYETYVLPLSVICSGNHHMETAITKPSHCFSEPCHAVDV